MNPIPLTHVTIHSNNPHTESHTLTIEDHPDLWTATQTHLENELQQTPEVTQLAYTLQWKDGRTLKGTVQLQPGVTTTSDLDLSQAIKDGTSRVMQSPAESLGLNETDLKAARERTQELILDYDLGPAFTKPISEF